jgi:hypothetical protein
VGCDEVDTQSSGGLWTCPHGMYAEERWHATATESAKHSLKACAGDQFHDRASAFGQGHFIEVAIPRTYLNCRWIRRYQSYVSAPAPDRC